MSSPFLHALTNLDRKLLFCGALCVCRGRPALWRQRQRLFNGKWLWAGLTEVEGPGHCGSGAARSGGGSLGALRHGA
eukprot:1153471-Pelagomonas_calceolata.AAC.4